MSNEESDSTADSGEIPVFGDEAVRNAVIDAVCNQTFTDWYEARQVEENILDGKSYFNGPSPSKPPDRHTPSKLLQCHRKATYARQNAPREGSQPTGLFWFGTEFEETVIVPYLQDATSSDLYIQNSVWIDTTVSTDGTDVRVRGATDPVIVTEDADPVVVTEIKTTTSTDHLAEPKPHHKAQLHAYLHALNAERDHAVTNGLLIYGSRKTLDLKVFHMTFDPEFWNRVVSWMAMQTKYEQAGELPPATPEQDWECQYCSFKHRCGKDDTPYTDTGVDGLLPLFTKYDQENLTEYLDAHADQGAKLTPTLAHAYPDLVDTYDAYDWSCPRCSKTYTWDAVDWSGDTSDPPRCPSCLSDGELLTLSGPEPDNQLTDTPD